MIRFALAAAIVAALGFAPAVAQIPDVWWQRGWVVEDVRCARCDAATLRRLHEAIGRTITLMPDRFENPLSASCAGRPDYDQLARRPRAEAEAAFRRHAPVPRLASPMIFAGPVRCPIAGGRLNTLGYFAFDNARRGYYRWDGGAVAVLR